MRLAGALGRAGRACVPPRGHRLLPLLSALLLAISFPPARLLAPPFIALVPFLLYLARLPPEATSRWPAVRAGYLLGLVYFGLLLYWLVVALVHYTPLAILAFTLTVLVLAGFTATFAWGIVYLRERLPGVPLAVSTAVLWTAVEWLQGHLGDLSFPWLGLGSALASFPRVAGAADLVGARGLSFWLALVNGLVAETIVAARGRRAAVRLATLAVLAVALPLVYGVWRAATLEIRPAARVAVVQPNIPEDLKMDRARAVDSSMAALARLTARIPPGSVDLVVWPEVALPLLLAAPDAGAARSRIERLSRRVRAPIVVGAYGYEWGADRPRPTIYNSAFLVTPDGIRGAAYSKQYLVPFVERIPFVDPAALERITGPLRWFGGLGHGRRAELYAAADGSRFGIEICYESIFAPLARRYRRAGAAYLVNMTNDSWYGSEPWYSRTSALWQHPAHLVMRAIEARIGVARSANTGISMFIDPLGRRSHETPLFRPEVRIGTVYTTDGLTPFVRWGDWLGTGAAAAALVLLVGARALGRARGPTPGRRRVLAAPPAA